MVSGGSGGYIIFDQGQLPNSSTNTFTGKFSVNGGMGSKNGYSGSGGRIFFNVNNEDNIIGGEFTSSLAMINSTWTQPRTCQVGAVGTVFYNDKKSLLLKGWESVKTS